MVAVLAVTGCAAACLAATGGTAAAGSVALVPGPVAPRAAAVRFGASRTGPARPGGAGQAALATPGNAAQAGPGRRGGPVVLGGSPGYPVANPKTGTVYVPIQCATSFCPASGHPGHVVDVINAAKCSTKVVSDCRVVARARVGTSPLAAAIDERTDTVYVVNGTSNSVSVLNGAACNASVTRGCDHPVATVKVGKFPVAAVVNPVTRTLYVANAAGGSVSVINAARCNAHTTSGCRRRARTVTDKASPSWLTVDRATDTVYVANSVTPGTVSVIDGAACNGHAGRGCGRVPATVTVGASPFGLAVDQASDTVYVANFVNDFNGGSVSVINGATCNGTDHSGCGRTPPAVPTGIGTGFVAVDSALHTVFAVNAGDDTLSAINTRTCDGTVTSGCATRPPNQQATPLQGPAYNSFANALALIGRTGSAYVVNVGGRNILSVTSIRRCNATNTSGCRAEAPTVPEGEFLLSADPATNTLYGANLTQPVIDVINSATCHARRLAGCAPAAEIPVPGGANIGAIDHATHTLYAAAPSSGKVFAINTGTCNAERTSGCASAAPSVKIGAFPEVPAINPGTQTMYVSYGANANKVAVVNAATCNATNTSGCSQTPAVIRVGAGTDILAVSAATNTVYAPSGADNAVAVINGATCNGTDHAGCRHLAAKATVGIDPFGAAVSDRTHTVYVANNADGDSPGTVSVINAATCNATDTTGCHRRFPTATTGNSPLLVVADARTGILYVTNFSSASVTILNTRRCHAQVTSGCRRATREQAVGSGPFGLAVNPRTRTVYVANGYLQPGSMSILSATRH
jgi:DNA-binding beta-propeller fold protein YncE